MKKLDHTACAARFLLGGIGTGNISVGARGNLVDFEIFGRPNKGFASPYTFFAIRTQDAQGQVQCRAMEAQLQPPFDRSHGFVAWEAGGLPRFEQSRMWGEYPFVWVTLTDPAMPVQATLEAFTPFVPLNAADSSFPGAVLRYRVRNLTDRPVSASVVGSFANLCGHHECDIWGKPLFKGRPVNQYFEDAAMRGIRFTNPEIPSDAQDAMEMAFATADPDVFYKENWNEGAWWDGIQDFWNDLSADGRLDNDHVITQKGNTMHVSPIRVGSLGMQKTIPAQGEAVYEFVLTWYRPNRVRSWDQLQDAEKNGRRLIRNHYATLFDGAVDAARKLYRRLPELEGHSRAFRDALFGGTLPEAAVDAVAANITVIRSNTCFRVADGTFFAYEGCFDIAGCCDGNCTHVWNYAQTLAFLFPELEQSMRRTEFLTETQPDGEMSFRARRYLQDEAFLMPPAADGQLGCVIRLYREWLISGDDAFLRRLWPMAKKALDFAFSYWDSDGDGILDNEQHNTYDIEFVGPNAMINAIFAAALKAGERISRYLGDEGGARRYAKAAKTVAAYVDTHLFGGEYYVQKDERMHEYKYQVGNGCLSDQLLGQLLAHVNGLGYVLDPGHVKQALQSIYRYNFQTSFHHFSNMQRTYALNDEQGLVLCTWPHGGRPEIPFVYSDEVWTGVEYHVAAHLIYEGFVDEGLRIVQAVRNRHDGIRRSPWNEVECGHHYARSLASYGVLLALSGFACDLPHKTIRFRPALEQNVFSTFFSCGKAWGVYRQTVDEQGGIRGEVQVLYGSLEGIRVLDGAGQPCKIV